MKRTILVLALIMSLSGCQIYETAYQKKKRELQQDVELLKLEKRKALLEWQLEELEQRVE